jgi:hypothetical protein
MRRAKVWSQIALAALAGVVFAIPAGALSEEDQLLFDIEPTLNARFGSAIATDRNYSVIGAPGD